MIPLVTAVASPGTLMGEPAAWRRRTDQPTIANETIPKTPNGISQKLSATNRSIVPQGAFQSDGSIQRRTRPENATPSQLRGAGRAFRASALFRVLDGARLADDRDLDLA